LLSATLECAFWSVMGTDDGRNGDLLSELVQLEEDVETGRFP
jgi:hypothetical protein